MYKFLKKHMCSICLMLILSAVFFLNPVEAKAAGPTDMELNNGAIEWQATSSNANSYGWKYYTEYWNFTIIKTINGKTTTKTVAVYENNAGYSHRNGQSWTDSSGRTYTPHYYSLPIENLESLSGMNLKEGEVYYIANAANKFRFLKKDGTWLSKKEYIDSTWGYEEPDTGTYTTADAFFQRCRDHWMGSGSPETNYTGYYGKDVKNNYYYITVKGDAGFDPNSFTGGGWKEKGSSTTVSGTTKHGYTSNGNKTITNIQSHQTVTLTSTPWQHTVAYDSAGGSPTPNSFTKTYGTAATITNTIPSKPGYTFVNWKSSVTGDIYEPGDSYTHSQNGGTDTLAAQYVENTATFIFDANGGTGTMPSITKKWSETLTLPENGFNHNGEVTFVGWDTDSGKIVATYHPGDTVAVSDIVTAVGKQYEKEAKITIYALWDALPRISAKDRYIDLTNAQNGFLTEDELFSLASAEDTEDGVIERGEKFYIKNLDLEKYKNLTAEGVNPSISFEETYVAIDSAGNKAEKTITVTVVNTATQPSDSSSAYNYVRFISLKYLDYPPEDGGLMADSFWRIPENNDYLRRVLSIHRVNPEVRTISFLGLTYSKEVPGTGEWNAPIQQEWHFSQEDIQAVKEYVDEHGLGNSKEPDALANFLELFADCRIQ